MRIALLSYDDSPPQGGQGVVVRDMRAALQALGVEVVTLSGRGDHAIAFPRRLGRAPLDFSLYLARHPELITAVDAGIVHLMGGPGGVLFTRRLNTPIVVTANHTYRQAHRIGSPRRGLSLVEARTYRRASRVLAVSASTASAVAAMGIPSDRIEVLAPGIQIPDTTGNSRDPKRVLFVGRLETEKGVLDAVSAMATLAARTLGVHGRVVGRGRLKAVVAAACADAPGVEFIGAVSDQQLAAEYAAAAVVLVPSAYEGLGLVALEAMAAGAAVCGYDVTGLRDAALGVAQLVTAGDQEALAKAAAALLDDPAARDELGKSGRRAVIAAHSWPAHAQRLAEIYAQLA